MRILRLVELPLEPAERPVRDRELVVGRGDRSSRGAVLGAALSGVAPASSAATIFAAAASSAVFAAVLRSRLHHSMPVAAVRALHDLRVMIEIGLRHLAQRVALAQDRPRVGAGRRSTRRSC